MSSVRTDPTAKNLTRQGKSHKKRTAGGSNLQVEETNFYRIPVSNYFELKGYMHIFQDIDPPC